MTSLKPIVAIDGPAGSGKSTVAKIVAKKCGLFYIDTGAMYRCLALKARETGVDPDDTQALTRLASRLDLEMSYDPRNTSLRVSLEGRDVSEEIRRPDVTRHVSQIAKIKEVRAHLVALQRKLAEGKRAILEGRDIATIVFPDAYKKFFLDANPEERVKRRFMEMKQKNVPVDESGVKRDIELRDRIDTTREHSPLKRAADAVYIDTTHLSIDQVVERVIEEIHKP
jgi:cytidylate kinase